ncbi:Long chronological lifespan protein 2 [Rhodotorula mucilaginosa]|uniref:Long chronological lifespan protein 2 n=1 Tax=Rhodotorula mucilaginosa TaxID=5537 RepID=A0A9P6VVT6_RHOMI|nr:Long chronological lifespan protein 2 [Rhodotorula mucilaginosa]
MSLFATPYPARRGGSIRSPLLIVVVALVLLPSFATAFFEQFFHQQHAQQQQAQRPPTWDEQLETVSCSTFICPDFTCVASPADCPCPSRMDEKCVIPDATGSGADAYVCARDCAKVTAAMHAFH